MAEDIEEVNGDDNVTGADSSDTTVTVDEDGKNPASDTTITVDEDGENLEV